MKETKDYITLHEIDDRIKDAQKKLQGKLIELEHLRSEIKALEREDTLLSQMRQMFFSAETSGEALPVRRSASGERDISTMPLPQAAKTVLALYAGQWIDSGQLHQKLMEKGKVVPPMQVTGALRRRSDLFETKKRKGRIWARLVGQKTSQEPAAQTQEGSFLRFSGLSAARSAEIILKERGEPMHLDDIGNVLRAGGYPHAEDPRRLSLSLRKSLDRDNRFIRVRAGTYDLKERYEMQSEALPGEADRARNSVGD